MTTSTFRVCRYFNYTNIAEPPTLANHKYMYIKLQVHLYHFISVFMSRKM